MFPELVIKMAKTVDFDLGKIAIGCRGCGLRVWRAPWTAEVGTGLLEIVDTCSGSREDVVEDL